ncbi:MAG: hypothetical protein ABJC89_24300 [Acidobacteriota bacterium]
MHRRILMIRYSIAIAACQLLLALPAAAQTADIAGNWDVTVATQRGTQQAPLVLKKDGDKLTGILSAPQQGDLAVEATVKDKAVTIRFTVPTQDGPLSLAMIGTVNGDTMTGTVDIAGEKAQWSAKRAAPAAASAASAAKLDVSGTWAFAVETAAGSGTPTITLAQQGEKLTGTYAGQLGEAPLTGTVKGSAIEFAIDLSVQGTALHIVYAGTAESSTMKGTIKLGELGDGTFTAKKTQ